MTEPAEPHKRKPIRTDLEAGNRCTSRFAGRRCTLNSGHDGSHDAGVQDGITMRWGGRPPWRKR